MPLKDDATPRFLPHVLLSPKMALSRSPARAFPRNVGPFWLMNGPYGMIRRGWLCRAGPCDPPLPPHGRRGRSCAAHKAPPSHSVSSIFEFEHASPAGPNELAGLPIRHPTFALTGLLCPSLRSLRYSPTTTAGPPLRFVWYRIRYHHREGRPECCAQQPGDRITAARTPHNCDELRCVHTVCSSRWARAKVRTRTMEAASPVACPGPRFPAPPARPPLRGEVLTTVRGAHKGGWVVASHSNLRRFVRSYVTLREIILRPSTTTQKPS
jgi:hypothetical protein